MVKARCRRLFIKLFIAIYAVTTVMAVVALVLSYCIWTGRWTPFTLNDGPFIGEPRAVAPAREPDQIFPVGDRFVLETYDAEEGEPAPTVVLKDRNGKTKWCMYAIANGMEKTSVKDIRFHAWHLFPLKELKVSGVVGWTYGHEQTLWFITRKGELDNYWYSW